MQTKNLLFLLAAAPMATGCIVPSDDTGNDETTGDGDGDPTTGDGDGDPTTGDGDGDPTTGDGDGDEGACNEYAANMAECFGAPYYDQTLSYCAGRVTEYATAYGPACVSALESYLVCLSALDCETLMDADPCPEEAVAYQMICE